MQTKYSVLIFSCVKTLILVAKERYASMANREKLTLMIFQAEAEGHLTVQMLTWTQTALHLSYVLSDPPTAGVRSFPATVVFDDIEDLVCELSVTPDLVDISVS